MPRLVLAHPIVKTAKERVAVKFRIVRLRVGVTPRQIPVVGPLHRIITLQSGPILFPILTPNALGDRRVSLHGIGKLQAKAVGHPLRKGQLESKKISTIGHQFVLVLV